MESTLNSPVAQPRAGAGSLSWIWQAVTGVGLVILAGLHMVAHHFVVAGGLRNFAEVLAYIRNPLIWPLEILFLICVTAHALLGVRAVIFDLGLSETAERRVTQVLWGVGLLAVAYGTWLTWVLVTYPA